MFLFAKKERICRYYWTFVFLLKMSLLCKEMRKNPSVQKIKTWIVFFSGVICCIVLKVVVLLAQMKTPWLPMVFSVMLQAIYLWISCCTACTGSVSFLDQHWRKCCYSILWIASNWRMHVTEEPASFIFLIGTR